MGAITRLGGAAESLAQVFVPNATAGQALAHGAHRAALQQLGAEFALPRRGLFDRFVDGLNRLPRPMLALGTLGLFIYAMVDPIAFGARMEGLAHVPQPLWWLLGAIVGFYFGARELHYRRDPRPAPLPDPVQSSWHVTNQNGDGADDMTADLGAGDNPALADWAARQQVERGAVY